jgi:hypothetical protein
MILLVQSEAAQCVIECDILMGPFDEIRQLRSVPYGRSPGDN